MTAKLRHDPARLIVLARCRDAARAKARALQDQIADQRERRTDLERRLQIAELTTQGLVGVQLEAALNQVTTLKVEVGEAREVILDTQADLAAANETAAEAQQLLRAAIKWAMQNNLTVPKTLADEAASLNPAHLGGGRILGATA